MWTGAVLLVYFALTNVQLWGLGTGGQGFGYFRTIVAGAQGSILQLGIGPIVTASITLQLLKGANLLDWTPSPIRVTKCCIKAFRRCWWFS